MKSLKYVIGIDEVGRGSLAGPVTVCAFSVSVKDKNIFPNDFKDSKALSSKSREEIYRKIKDLQKINKCAFRVASVGSKYIDEKGINRAINLALRRVLRRLSINPDSALVYLDGGLKAPQEFRMQKTIIRGDEKESIIAAASIIAKVTRDRFMVRLSKKYPEYGFEKHKGYGTRKHIESIRNQGISRIHRVSFLSRIV